MTSAAETEPRAPTGRCFYRTYGKRALDLTLGIPAVLAAGPLMLVVATGVRLSLGSPVLFRQQRPGLGGAPFCLLKFRSMRDARDALNRPLPDEDRLTDVGRLVRALSLDELPSLLNVVRGEMSLVGPRPLLMHYLPRYSPRQARRHEVKPGITGWAAVNGRNALSWEQKFEHDVWYVDNVSLWLDLRILAQTLAKVVMREGISAPGEATMPEFMGSLGDAAEAP